MTDLSTSCSSETENVTECDVDEVSSRERGDSEAVLICSIKTNEGEKRISEDDVEDKRDIATKEENSETKEENEILDSDKGDDSKASEASLNIVGTESLRPDVMHSNVGAKPEENVSSTSGMCSKIEFNEVETSSNSHEQSSKVENDSSKAEEHSSKVGENGTESLNVQDESSSKAEEAFSKVGEECLNADKKCSAGDKELSKTDAESAKTDEQYSSGDKEISKTDVECSKANEQYSTGDKEISKTDVDCSKEDEEFPIADKECSKADEEFSKANKDISDADKEIAEGDKEIAETEEVCLKSAEDCSVSEEESSQSDEECSQEVEEYSEADEEFSKEVEEYSEAGEEFLKSEVKNAEAKETKFETPPSSRMLEEGSHVEEETCLKVEVIAAKGFSTEGHGSDVEEESSYAEEDSFLTDEDSLVTEENSSKAEENSSKTEENSSKAEENTKQETSNENNIVETERNSNRNNANLSCEVLEENSGTEEVEDEEEGDTETEDGSSQASGTEQEDSEDDGDDDEEDGEADGSDKDAESESGWDEKRHMGDGEEETAVKVERKLDDDEDKANPAYIPRKGAFYEHDSRLGDVDGEDDVKEEKEQQNVPGKRLWVDDHKWEHDRFDARQQAPKSAQDLIEAYGFDIRRGAESDIPVRDSMPRTRRPGDKNRFGDFVHRQDSEEHSGDDGERRYSDRTASNRNRNRFNNGNRRYQGRRENFRNNDAAPVGFANSDFPALNQNVEIVVKTNTADDQHVQDRYNDERNSGNFRRRPDRRDNRDEDTEDVEARGRNQYDRRGGAADRNTGDVRRGSDRRGFVDEEIEEDFDDRRRSWHERRGGAYESRGAPRFNRGRGRGRGSRGQRGRGEPDGRNRNWQQREENNEVRHDRNDNEYRVRNSRNSESSVVEEIPRRAVGSQESRQRVDSETSQSGDLESRHSRQKDFDNERSDYGPRGERGDGRETVGSQARGYDRPRGRGNTGRYEGSYDSQEQRSRRGQEHSYRGQRPRQERDNRFRDKDQQEYFTTRTIQNSNISGGSGGRPYSDAKTREEEKQELLSSVTSEIKRMNINERELAARQQQASHSASEKVSEENLPGSYWQGRRVVQRGAEGEARTVQEKPRTHQDISSTRPSADDGNVDVRRKPSVIIQTTDAPEMLPPVTCIQTFSKPTERAAPESRPSDRPPNKGWAGGEFTPAWRLQPAPANKPAEMIHAVPSGKPKRYSTSRQKAAGAEAAYTEPINTDYQAAIGAVSQQPLTAALPSRPLPAATYYDSSSSYVAAPSFHAAPGLPLGMHQMAAYQMQANAQAAAQQGLYNSQPYMNNAQAAKPGTPIQHMYMPHSGSMMPGPYMSMMNYPSPFPMAPVHLAPGAQPTHMHHGSMPDQESIEMHRMMYYNQQGIPMSVMQQYVDQSAYMTEQSQVDHNIGPESYIGAGELTSQSQGAHEY